MYDTQPPSQVLFGKFPLSCRVLSYNPGQNVLERLHNLTVVHFNPQTTEFSLLLNIPRPPTQRIGKSDFAHKHLWFHQHWARGGGRSKKRG